MINEVLYCERLMYLEFVQGEWADNAFTADGQAVHRKVNEEGKPLRPAPDGEGGTEGEEERPYVARSVWLSSERLGITAKLDLVEVEGGRVVPVEYKRGKRPDVPAGAYLPELAQVCAQVLLVREHGYVCDHGEIYYAMDRQRVEIAIPEWLIARTLAAAARIRELALAGVLPPPLEDSPKCHGCSLVGICLPDETRPCRPPSRTVIPPCKYGGPIEVRRSEARRRVAALIPPCEHVGPLKRVPLWRSRRDALMHCAVLTRRPL